MAGGIRSSTTPPTPLMRRYFSPAFNQAWAGAMKRNKDFPVFDADPLTGEQNGGGMNSVSATMAAPNRVASDNDIA